MILTCPSCSTRYSCDPASFQPSGRMVRCANCGHSWFQKPPDDLPRSASESGGAASGPLRIEPVGGSGKERSAGLALPMPISNLAIWGLLVVAILGFMTLLYQYRVEIVRGWPQMASAYSLVGIDVNSVGIIFRDFTMEREEQEGVRVLAVRGHIVNLTEEALPIPRIRLTLFDEGGEELYHWTVVLDETRLGAGESREVLTRLSSPPLGVRGIEVSFDEGGE